MKSNLKKSLLATVFVVAALFVLDFRYDVIWSSIQSIHGHIEAKDAEAKRVPRVSYHLQYFTETSNERREIFRNFGSGHISTLQFWDYPVGTHLIETRSTSVNIHYSIDKESLLSLISDLESIGIKELSTDVIEEGERSVEGIIVEIDGEELNLRFKDLPSSPLRSSIHYRFENFFRSQFPDEPEISTDWISQGDNVEPIPVSVEDLLREGALYDGKRVSVSGYLIYRFEHQTISPAAEHMFPEECIWVARPSYFADPNDLSLKSESVSTIVGVYSHGPSGQWGLFPGSILRLTSVRPTDGASGTEWNPWNRPTSNK
jgi:hypothetical protein